jgi:peptide/nickel transport system permease protein
MKAVQVIPKKIKRRNISPTMEVIQRLLRNKAAVAGMVIFFIVALAALTAPLYIDYDAQVLKQNMAGRFQPPSAEHWFGTDAFGRDVFSRIVYGARLSLFLGLVSTAMAAVVGTFFGVLAGYFEKKVDTVIMRIMDTFMAIPSMIFLLAIVATLGTSIPVLLFAVVMVQVPGFTRIVKSAVLMVSGQEYIEAAKAHGALAPRIILKYVLPNAMGPIIVQTSMSVAMMIVVMAGLSFIGMGVQPPTPEWGLMLSDAKEYMRHAPQLMLYPGLAITITALSINLFGDGLRDALDPKLKD